MKKLSKIFLAVILTVVGLTVFLTHAEAESVGPTACSISPGSASMSQSSSVVFTATSDRPSVSGDYVYVTAREFSNGVYSDINVGKVIPIGASSLDFRVYAQNTAEAGSKTFKVYCSTGCPFGGCPSGGVSETLGSAIVNLTVEGTNVVEGGAQIPTGTIPTPPVSNASGRVKLTQTKDIKETLFPSSVCGAVSGCRGGFGEPGSLMVPISVMLGTNPPALVGGEMIRLSGGSNTAHPRLFNLIDPLSPIDSNLSGSIRSGGAYDTYGDFGSSLRVMGVAYSNDKSVWAISDSQGSYYVWKDGKRYKHPRKGSTNGPIQKIVKVGQDYILLDKKDAFDISDGMKFVKSYVDLEGQTKEEYELVKAPSDFPKLPYGDKFILGNDEYILTINTSNISDKKIAIHSVNSSTLVDEQALSKSSSSYKQYYGVIPVSGADYIYLLKYSAASSLDLLTLYKFDHTSKKITEVVKDVSLAPGFVTASASFGANSANPGVVVFSSDATSRKMQVYLISDLIQGKGIDSLSNSPVWTTITSAPSSAASLTLGDVTYVYSSDAGVYKLELSSTYTKTIPVVETPVYTNPEGPVVVGCPNGRVYDTSAGKLCVSSSGVTTTTSYNFDTTTITPPTPGCEAGKIYNTLTGVICPKTKTTEFIGPPVSEPNLRQGSKGEAVKELQIFLNEKLSLGLVVDGKMGPATVAAVKQWQNGSGLVSDGIVGPKTRELMQNAGL